MKTMLMVKGMHCPRCQAKVKKSLEALPGVHSARVGLEEGNAVVDHDGAVSIETLAGGSPGSVAD